MLNTNRERQAALDRLLSLRYPAVALKLTEDDAETAEGAERPMADWGKHISLCQAFAYARRQGKVLHMHREDEWCWSPLMNFGLAERAPGSVAFEEKVRTIGIADPEKAAAFVEALPHYPMNERRGMLIAPLPKADFPPDALLIYAANPQLRLMLMAVNSQTGGTVPSSFTPLESCIFSVIPAIRNGEYRVTLPDPGEYERALVAEDQIIFTVPAQRFAEFFSGVEYLLSRGKSPASYYPMMAPEFDRPPFYNRVFESWGLATGALWDKK